MKGDRQEMKKTKIVFIAFFTACIALSLCMAVTASAETNAEGWEKRADGYYYEIDPPVTDIFQLNEISGTEAYGWYLVNYTGYIEGGAQWPAYITPAQGAARTAFNAKNNSVQSYYTEYGSVENAAKQMLVIQSKIDGYKYTLHSGASAGQPVSETFRHTDFTFNLDFTNLTKGWFTYFNEGTLIEFNLNDNAIRFKQHSRPAYINGTVSGVANSHGLRYGSYGGSTVTTATYSLTDHGIDLKSLTGNHTITLLIEDRLSEGKASTDIMYNYSDGASVTVKIDDLAVTHVFDTMHYYCGEVGFVNYTDSTLDFYSTKYSLNFDTDGGTDTPSVFFGSDEEVWELPTPEKGAYIFDGWFTDETCAEGTEFVLGSTLSEDTTLYAKWIAPVSVNAEGWEFNADDGYYYEPDPPVRDFLSFHESAEENKQTDCDWYVIEYTGTMFNNWNNANAMQITGRTAFDYEHNVVPSGKAVIAQYDWGYGYCKQGACWNPEYTNITHRYMDFTFNLDFTNLYKGVGYFTYIHDNILITFDLNSDQIIIQEKEAANKLQYSYNDSEVFFVDCEGLSALTGVQRITVLIEDRVKTNTGEITRENNKGVRVTVSVGDGIRVTRTIKQCGYYAGIFGIFNYMQVDLEILSAKKDAVKDDIRNYVKESDYSAEIWSEMDSYIESAVLAVDGKELSELDAYYAEVAAKLDEYPTLAEQQAKQEKYNEVIAAISEKYKESAYSAENWARVSALINEYTGKMNAAVRAAEVTALYKRFIKEADKYFTLADRTEQEALLAEITGYGKDKNYYAANKNEIEEIRAEYLAEINNAPSIWDARMLFSAAKADIDSFIDAKPGETKPENSATPEKKGCRGSSGIESVFAFSAVAVVAVYLAVRRRKGCFWQNK